MNVFFLNLEKAPTLATSHYLKSGFEGVSTGAAISYATGKNTELKSSLRLIKPI
jgi:hypothetical protein|tara:strand:+ start:478 stop:639 length:162 start_codon:yes stop_codon:yes gene_type:complete